MIAIIDYNTGNLCSVCNALDRIGAEYIITDNPALIKQADKVLLPGVGDASAAMQNLIEKNLCNTIKELTQPVLGICVGMQIMCTHSQEGETDCLDIFHTNVNLLLPDKNHSIKVPHMGWNNISGLSTPLFKGIKEDEYMYFVHSYAPQICANTIAISNNGVKFSAALCNNNFYGTQFHPEKSGETGEQLLKNFIEL